MGKYLHFVLLIFIVLTAGTLHASIFGTVHGLIHDPQHRPVADAQVTLRAVDSDWAKSATSNTSGEFTFDSVPIGKYTVSVDVPGFANQEQNISVDSSGDTKLHFALTVASASETVQVSDTPSAVNTESSTTSSLISRQDIGETPGADQTNSLAMITDYVPGAYVVHDQLHIRGGHQVEWLVDGVPVPNTNIASNVGPQFDPKDIDYLEVQRGGYSADYGDRTYGVFNVVTRSGFERNRQAELVANYGSYNGTNNQLSFGDHTQRFAYYGSVSGNRTDLGLETPTPHVLNDQAAGLSGFGSLIFNKTPNDQLRLVTSIRGDHFQVPNSPDLQTAGVRDVENERDAFANFSWLHTFGEGVVLTVSPFYHFNRAHYVGRYIGAPDFSVAIPQDDRGSNYMGGVISLGVTRGRHTVRTGFQVFGQRDSQLFAVSAGDGTQTVPPDRARIWGNVEALFVQDQFKATSWLTLNAGARLTHFQSGHVAGLPAVAENAADPRIGAAVHIPKLGWVARAFWGRYYQAPPLLSVSGTLLEQCNSSDCGFLPLHGERDEQREFGLTVPVGGWTVDLSNFRTGAKNFFDHDVLGNSNIFFPLTIDRARIRGWEATATSPRIAGVLHWHLAYSNQTAQGRGGITGGLTDFGPPETAYFFLDHDQRTTISTGVTADLPWHVWTAFNVEHGSGFLNGDGPAHLPPHTTFDLSLGKSFGENWSVRMTALNLGNASYMVDNSNTFGGSHFANPRELSVQVKYRFRY